MNNSTKNTFIIHVFCSSPPYYYYTHFYIVKSNIIYILDARNGILTPFWPQSSRLESRANATALVSVYISYSSLYSDQ